MKSKYFIYHIPGIKIGVSNNPKTRTKVQGFSEYEILEEHTNAKEVSKRERILQAQYGYPVDKIEYWKTLKMQKKATTKKVRKKAIANTDYQAFQAKKVANTDWVARVKKCDWERYSQIMSKPVNQYDKQNNFIKTFNSIKLACEEVKGFDANIIACCKGKQKTSYKYIWKYAG